MIHAPSDEEIGRVEEKITRARREFLAGAENSHRALHDALAKPTTLLGVAGTAGLAGYLMFRRRPTRIVRSSQASQATAAAASTSLAGIVLACAMRYATQRLPGLGMKLVGEAMRKRSAESRARNLGVTLH